MKTEGLKAYVARNSSKVFKDVLFMFIDRKGVKDSLIYKKVNIDRKLFSKIRCNKNYIPTKNTIIKLCLALELCKKDFDTLLGSAGYVLTTNSKIDLTISYCLEQHIYDLMVINGILFEECNTVL